MPSIGPVRTNAQPQPPVSQDPLPTLLDKFDKTADAKKMTALQKHVAYFDRNHDGKVTLAESYEGCRAMGMGRVASAISAILIHGGSGWATTGGLRPTLDVSVKNAHRGMHGSDSELYDADGNFDAKKFDAFFDRWDKDGDGYWSWGEFWARTQAQHDLWDIFGGIATLAEFGLVFLIAGEDGKISRESLRKTFDGTLFYELEKRRRK